MFSLKPVCRSWKSVVQQLPISCLLLWAIAAPADIGSVKQFNTEKINLEVELVTSGLNKPWSVAFIDKDRWLVTERGGQLRQVIAGKLSSSPIKGLPDISASGQGGLLDIRLHPDFASNKTLYLSYVGKDKTGIGTEVIKARLQGDSLIEKQKIFVSRPKKRGGRHFGSRLEFDANGYLYISLGDRGDRNSAQDGQDHAGTIIRLTASGETPADNPFANTESIHNEIYSTGHRNVQGMVYDPESRSLWAHEHGPQGGDELNLILGGRNYGWPVITYGANYGSGTKIGEGRKKQGMEQPRTYWTPSIAPSGMAFVNSNRFPEWKGDLLVGALKYQLIVRLQIENGLVIDEERLFEQQYGRIRDVRQGPDGYLYFLTDSSDGKIYRIRPSE